MQRVDFPNAICYTIRDFPTDVAATFSVYLVPTFRWVCLLSTGYIAVSTAIAFIVLKVRRFHSLCKVSEPF